MSQAIPLLDLNTLPERTKDFLLTLCNGESLTPEQAVRKVLNREALLRDSRRSTQPEAQAEKAAMAA